MTKTILATTYAVNPYKGSEDGMGWNFVCQIARFNQVIAITRENNRPHIERYMAENPNEIYQNIQFLYFDLPYWMRFWKKGGRGAMLYYWMWQNGIVRFIKRQSIQYDIVHNVNFHNDWTPSYLWKLNKPFVWGPVGHHPIIPSSYLTNFNWKIKLKEKLTWFIKQLFWKLSPGLVKTKNKARVILAMNSHVNSVLKNVSSKIRIMPSVASENIAVTIDHDKKDFKVISVGRFVALKGFDLTIESFAQFIFQLSPEERLNAKLILVGSGPEKGLLKTLVKKHNIVEFVEFIEWIERKDLFQLYEQSSVFLFPSHEGAGMVVAEAMTFGLPTICLNNSGPGEFIDPHSGMGVDMNDYHKTVVDLSVALKKLYSEKDTFNAYSIGARKRFEHYFDWNRRGEQLNEIYNNL